MPLLLLDSSGALASSVTAIVIAPVTEEVFKGLAVLAIYLLWRREFDGVFDGIVYGGLVGFGFAALENVLYFIDGDGTVFVLRALVFGLNHAFYTSLTGIGLGIARHARSLALRIAAPLGGLAAAIGAHALHNLTLTFAEGIPALVCLALLANWGGVVFVFVIMLIATRRERRWIIDELCDEVALKTLSESQYTIATSPVRRFSARLDALFSGGPVAYWHVGRYLYVLTKLAYAKNARRQRGDAGASAERVNTLRTQAAALSVEMAGLR